MFPVYKDENSVEAGSYKRVSALGSLREELSGGIEEEPTPAAEEVEKEEREAPPKVEQVKREESKVKREESKVKREESKVQQEESKGGPIDFREIESLRQNLMQLENLRFNALRTLISEHRRMSGAPKANVDMEAARHFVAMFDERRDIPRTGLVGNPEIYLSDLRARVQNAATDFQKLKQKLAFLSGGGK